MLLSIFFCIDVNLSLVFIHHNCTISETIAISIELAKIVSMRVFLLKLIKDFHIPFEAVAGKIIP